MKISSIASLLIGAIGILIGLYSIEWENKNVLFKEREIYFVFASIENNIEIQILVDGKNFLYLSERLISLSNIGNVPLTLEDVREPASIGIPAGYQILDSQIDNEDTNGAFEISCDIVDNRLLLKFRVVDPGGQVVCRYTVGLPNPTVLQLEPFRPSLKFSAFGWNLQFVSGFFPEAEERYELLDAIVSLITGYIVFFCIIGMIDAILPRTFFLYRIARASKAISKRNRLRANSIKLSLPLRARIIKYLFFVLVISCLVSCVYFSYILAPNIVSEIAYNFGAFQVR